MKFEGDRAINFFFKFFMQSYLNFPRNSDLAFQTNVYLKAENLYQAFLANLFPSNLTSKFVYPISLVLFLIYKYCITRIFRRLLDSRFSFFSHTSTIVFSTFFLKQDDIRNREMVSQFLTTYIHHKNRNPGYGDGYQK